MGHVPYVEPSEGTGKRSEATSEDSPIDGECLTPRRADWLMGSDGPHERPMLRAFGLHFEWKNHGATAGECPNGQHEFQNYLGLGLITVLIDSR